MTNYQNLEAWKKSLCLVKEIYIITRHYPKDELYALTQQTKKAALSVPANIAEGLGRNSKRDTLHFLFIARGSMYELETHIQIGKMLEFINEIQCHKIRIQINECLRLINGLISYVEKSIL